MIPEIITAVAVSAAGGGLTGSAITAWTAKRKVPAEVDSIIVHGAETAVVALQAVLTAETARADREAERADRAEAKAEALEKRLDMLQQQLDEARQELHNMLVELKSQH